MTVPETSIDLNDGLIARKHKVGLAGKILNMQSIAEPSSMQAPADQKLRFCILAPDSRHHLASFFRANSVSQRKRPIANLTSQ